MHGVLIDIEQMKARFAALEPRAKAEAVKMEEAGRPAAAMQLRGCNVETAFVLWAANEINRASTEEDYQQLINAVCSMIGSMVRTGIMQHFDIDSADDKLTATNIIASKVAVALFNALMQSPGKAGFDGMDGGAVTVHVMPEGAKQ